MEILKKRSAGPHKFRVLKSFLYGGKNILKDEVIQLEEPDAGELVAVKKVFPIFPDGPVECVALKTFILPGLKEKFEAKPGEKILIKNGDLLPLLLLGVCIPSDDSVWRPLKRRLKKQH